MSDHTPSPTDADGELKLILSEHWRDEGQHTSVYPVCPECRTRLLALIQAERAQAALEAITLTIDSLKKHRRLASEYVPNALVLHETVLEDVVRALDNPKSKLMLELAALKQGANHAK